MARTIKMMSQVCLRTLPTNLNLIQARNKDPARRHREDVIYY